MTNPQEVTRHWIQSTYTLLGLMGIDPSRISSNHEHDGGRVLIALPDTRVGLATEGDSKSELENDGWYCATLSVSQMQALDQIMSTLDTLVFEDMRRTKQTRSKSGSKEEETMLAAIMRAGISRPNRNLRIARDDGKELTTPDFAWEDEKVAFFIDGLWWHVAKDDTEIVDAITGSIDKRTRLMDGNKTRAERDAEIRSTMTADGWVVLSCTDRHVNDPKELAKHVARVGEVLDRRRREREAITKASAGDDHSDFMDLL